MSPDIDLAAYERQLRSMNAVPEIDMADDLAATAAAMVAPGKGILAADESNGTAGRRLEAIGLSNDADTRRQYREMLFTTPGLEEFISGVILYDETMRQKSDDGRPLPRLLADAGIMTGIKLDTGTTALAGHPGEDVTSGLDGLRQRLAEYVAMGARFGKWRAVIHIGDDRPTDGAILANMHALARYAAICQEAGVVPIVEPEVLMDGGHSIDRNAEVTTQTLQVLFEQLTLQQVVLEGTVLKVNMVLPGAGAAAEPTPQEVADATLRVLSDAVPAAIPGVAFLSGGQSAEDATQRLDAMNRSGTPPWSLTFSYGRALQQPVLDVWDGTARTRDQAQTALLERARSNAAASTGARDTAGAAA